MGKIERFKTGEGFTTTSFRRKLDAIVERLNRLERFLGGDGLIKVVEGPTGKTISLDIDALRQRIGRSLSGVQPGQITQVDEDASIPMDHKYKAAAVDGRVIDEFTSPDQPRDAAVLYIAAAVGDWCLMWWEDDGTGHIFAVQEVYDTIEDV